MKIRIPMHRWIATAAALMLLSAAVPVLIAQEEAPEDPSQAVAPEAAAEEAPTDAIFTGRIDDRVRIGASLNVRANEIVKDAVSVFGSSQVDGAVQGDMVTVFGDAHMNGSVDRDMVTVFGDAEINGSVGRDLVVVFGSLKLGPNARVGLEGHDCVVIFGAVEEHPDAIVEHDVQQVLPQLSGLSDYVRDGLFLGRLIPPTSIIAWIVVGIHLVLYLLVALLVPKPVASCVEQLRAKPLQSFGVGILVMILMAPLGFILVATGIGILLLPFLGLAELAFLILGKTAILELFGMKILRWPQPEKDASPVAPFLAGFALVTVLYMIPVVGIIVWTVLRPLSLGAPVMMLFAMGRKNGNGRTPSAPPIPVQAGTPAVQRQLHEGTGAAQGSQPQMMSRAGFWIRTAASALDLLLVAFLAHLAGWSFSGALLLWLVYHIALWTWMGATIGGLICKLKVVRLDGSPVDFGASLVRGLTSVLSGLALGLGFFWVCWTPERQSWHDRAAGTVMVCVPKETSIAQAVQRPQQ